jgi:hypothetical protein
MVSSLPLSSLLLLLLLLSAASFGGGVRLGDGGYEDWRLGTATYVKEFQSHPLNDGMCVCFPFQQKKKWRLRMPGTLLYILLATR